MIEKLTEMPPLPLIISIFSSIKCNCLNKLKLVFLIFNVCTFSYSSSYAQISPNRNFTVEDGLINSIVFAIAQDSSGFIWFGTENGLSRFDGIEFKNYSLEFLGVNSYISSVKCMGNDMIYFGTGNDGIYSFEKKTGNTKKINKDNVSQSSDLIFFDSTLISLHEQHNLDLVNLPSGRSSHIDEMINNDPENKSYSILKHSNDKVYIGRKSGLYEFINNKQVKIPGFDLPVFSICEKNNGELLIGSMDAVYLMSQNHLFRKYSSITPNDLWIRNVLLDSNDNLWFSPWGTKDIFMIANNNSVNVSEVAGIRNTSITRLFQDRDGNIWVGTIGKGVYLFTNMPISIYPTTKEFPNADIRSICQAPGGLILGTNDGLAFLDSASGKLNSIKYLQGIEYVKDIVQVNKLEFVAAITDARVKLQKQYSFLISKIKVRYCQGSSLALVRDEILVGNWDNCFLRYSLSDYSFIKSECELFPGNFNKVRINSTYEDENGTIWIGSQKGVLIKDIHGQVVKLETHIKNENVISIIKQKNNKVAVVTNSGFVIFENHTQISKIHEIKKVHIPQTTSICFMNDQEYLAGTLNGIIYHYKDNEIVLSVHHGILSENVNCIVHFPGWEHLYIGSTEGLVKINLQGLRNSMNENLKIHYLAVSHNNQTYADIKQTLEFDYNSAPFSLLAKSFVYQSPKSIRYQFRHNKGNWTTAPAGGVYFTSLEPGNHIVEVRACKDEGIWGPVSKVAINIIPPFYKTSWFYILSLICFLSIVFYIFRIIFQYRRRKHDDTLRTKQLLVELQQKALASNLNPHFVFNSLNSIQHFINTSNQEDANNYLVKFSQLMRMQLNMADMSFVSIAEEISRLENYLSLEQMRFGKRLKWSITTDDTIDRYQIKIPNMILQPFVENSIWHGIMPMKTEGIVKIYFSIRETNELEISIIDNGVGIGTVPKPAGSNHKSKGVQLIFDRLTLLDPDKKDFITFSSNNPGTCVTILLSPKMYRNLSVEISI